MICQKCKRCSGIKDKSQKIIDSINHNRDGIIFKIISPFKQYINFKYYIKLCHYYPDLGVIFYHLPKAAGTSIHNTLSKKYRHEMLTIKKANKLKLFKFTFKRESLSRMASAWRYTLMDKQFRDKYKLYKESSFEEWIKRTREIKYCKDVHTMTFEELYGNVDFDFVGNFETIDEDFKKLLNILKIDDLELLKLNVSNKPSD